MQLKATYLFLVFGFILQTTFAQDAKLVASVSKNKLGVNQRLRIEFAINVKGADNFTPPNFKNFRVVGGPSQSISQSYVQGKFSYSQSYTYIIQPKVKGELVIPAASIEFDGKTIKSESIKVRVLDAVELPKNPNDPNYIAQQNIHLVAEVSKSRPYVGEGVYVEYRLYFSNNVGISDYGITEAPQYNGFWHQNIKLNGLPVKNGKYNGENYRYAVLQKALLIPTKSGKLSLDPMKMDIVVAVPTGRADFFGNAMTRNIRKDYSSPKKIIRVRELPLENKPANFNGAVGDFNYVVTTDKSFLKANESSQIKVQVTGKGNLKLFELPKIVTPKELEVYTPEHKEKVRITTTGMSGNISDIYTVVPEYKGKYKIPNTSFSYFNPEDKKYHTLVSEDLFVEVLEGKEIPTNTDNTNANVITKQKVNTTGENFRYIQTKSSFTTNEISDFYKSSLFYALLLLPLIAIPVGVIIAKKNEERNADIVGNKQRKADRLAKKYLSEANKKLGKKEAFYEALERALHNYLKAKLKVETSDISIDKIAVILADKDIGQETVSQFTQVLKDCDFARYTPTTNVEMKQEYEKAKHVITQLDKQL